MQQLLRGESRATPAETSEEPLLRTLLLDDCQHTLTLSERQPLVAMLNSGVRAASRYVRGGRRYCLFGPKAFAANSALPPSLAARCIPVVLMRKPPSALVNRFVPAEARAQAQRLLAWLFGWQERNASALARQATRAGIIDFAASAPTPHSRECAEPLLSIADVIGGHWPERARAALVSVFHCAETSLSVQLLSDIRLWFYVRGNPEYLSSGDLLASLATLDHRPWSAWPANSGRRLGALLHPFGIFSRNLHSSGRVFKGYMFKHLQGAFDRYLPPLRIGSATKSRPAVPSATEFPSVFNDLSA
jgi:putative DNA primase/helicase